MPSLFNGQFGEALKESFARIKFGGETPLAQKVFFINLQEIKGIKFGTRTPINYFDNFYNTELFLRTHGTYSVKVTDPLKLYREVIPKNAKKVEIDHINSQFLDEFLEALQSSINQMSADGIRISYVASKGRELGKYMAETLDEEWKQMRGMEIRSVGIGSISYDEESQNLINMRNKGAMMGDPFVREGYVQSTIAEGMKGAGLNTSGAVSGFMGMGMGMQAGGGFMSTASNTNLQQMQMNQAARMGQEGQASGGTRMNQPVETGQANQQQGTGQEVKPEAGNKTQGGAQWFCPNCGTPGTGNFCSECGGPRPAPAKWTCSKCGNVNTGKFCSNCGTPRG
jgi:membrane protease subunit (stomatin/prohibitin family)